MIPRRPVLAILALVALSGCATPEFDVPISFVVPQGHDSFDGLDYLALTADYGSGLAYDFWLEAPASGSTWAIPSIPVGDTVSLSFEGLVSDGLGGGGQVVTATGDVGPLAIGPDAGGVSVLFSRHGRIGALPGALDVGRRDPMTATLPGGGLLVMGGSQGLEDDGDPAPIDAASIFGVSGAEGSWAFSTIDRMRGPRMDGVALPIVDSGTALDGQVVVLGTISLLDRRTQGVTVDFEPGDLEEALAVGMPEVLDPVEGSWSDFDIDAAWEPEAARAFFTVTQVADRLLVVGGVRYNEEGGEVGLQVLADCWEIELATGDVRALSAMDDTRWAHTTTLLGDGRLLVVGGANVPTNNQTYPESSAVEVYDIVADSWSVVADLSPGRADQVAATLLDGRVLIAGGVTEIETVALGDSWIFDPAGDTLTRDADMVTPRLRANHTVLADGRVLVCGGEDADQAAVMGCELWTPGVAGAGVWSPMPDPASGWTARTGSGLATLPGGEAAIIGGLDPDGAYSTDVLIVRP